MGDGGEALLGVNAYSAEAMGFMTLLFHLPTLVVEAATISTSLHSVAVRGVRRAAHRPPNAQGMESF